MTLKKVNDIARYQEIVEQYKRKGALTNDYLYAEVEGLTAQGQLYEYCGEENAFLFVRKDECLRVYYYLNDLTETLDFALDENLVVEILFRGSLGTPDAEIDYLTRCGFSAHLRRDQAQTAEEVAQACDLFNSSFDHYSGDYISKEMELQLFTGGNILVATDIAGHFTGALHQTIEKGVAWISHVAVLPEYRGHGVGKALIRQQAVEAHEIDIRVHGFGKDAQVSVVEGFAVGMIVPAKGKESNPVGLGQYAQNRGGMGQHRQGQSGRRDHPGQLDIRRP